jgi:hypothetical protein
VALGAVGKITKKEAAIASQDGRLQQLRTEQPTAFAEARRSGSGRFASSKSSKLAQLQSLLAI